jgi:hypothetical protein
MKNRRTQNERMDEIGRGLLEASKIPDSEIENIAAAPHLFRSIRSRIESEKPIVEPDRFFKGRPDFAIWNWRLSLAAYILLAVFLGGAIAVSLVSQKFPSPDVVENPIHTEPIVTIDTGHYIAPPQPGDGIQNPVLKTQTFAQKTVAKTKSNSTERPHGETEEVGEFYPLTYTDNADTDDDDGQIVRVELPRSSLVAMGVDVPSENGADKLKTDLLIGSDGVMKAVRFVK